MIGTSHRGPIQRSVFSGHSGHQIAVLRALRERAQAVNAEAVY
ncbi:unnamed protein product, partial [Staurois parvus]